MDNNELYHYGIKGQRWGIRRFQKKNGSLTPAGKKRQKEKWSDDATEASKIKKKGVKEMSNAELKRLNERVRLEQEYSRLNPSTRKKAIAAVTATAATMGTLLNLYNNSDKLIAKGKPIAQKLIKPISEKLKKEMAIGLWSDIHSDELYHYGVKGMKWGVRRATRNKSVYKHKAQKQIDINKKAADVAQKRINSGRGSDNRRLTNVEIKSYKKERDKYTRAAKEWSAARDDIMKMDVTKIAAKDIEQRFKNAKSAAGGIYIT